MSISYIPKGVISLKHKLEKYLHHKPLQSIPSHPIPSILCKITDFISFIIEFNQYERLQRKLGQLSNHELLPHHHPGVQLALNPKRNRQPSFKTGRRLVLR